MEDAAAAKREHKRKRDELDELTNASNDGSDGLVQLSIEEAFLPGLKEKADSALARFLYAEGVPFVKTESSYLREFLQFVGAYGRGYAPPSMRKLRTILLDDGVLNVQQRLQAGACSCYSISQ